MDLDKIGKFIFKIRKEKKLTQAQLAELTGASDKTISKWENGNSFPDLVYQAKLCEALDIFLEELHSGEYNIPRRKQIKRRKIINRAITIYSAITIPLIIFLCFFFVNNYDATKIYAINTSDNKTTTAAIEGLLVKTNKTNLMHIGYINVLDYEVKDTDIVSVNVYNDKTVLYHTNKLNSIIFKFDENIKIKNLKIEIEITDVKNKVKNYSVNLETINITNSYNQMRKVSDELILLEDDDVNKNLKEAGFKKVDENWQKITKNKKVNEMIIYYPKLKRVDYVINEKPIVKNVKLNLKTKDLEVYIFHDDETVHALIEKYVYDYNTKEIDCQYGPCSTLKEVLEIMDVYLTLLSGE